MRILILIFATLHLISCKQERAVRKINKLKTTSQNIIETSKLRFDGSYVLDSKVNNKGHYSESKSNFCVFTFYKDGEFKRSANYYESNYLKIDSLEQNNKQFYDLMSAKEIKCVYRIIKSDSIVMYELYKNVRNKQSTEYTVSTYSIRILKDTLNICANNNLRLDQTKLFYVPKIRQKK